MRRIPLPPIKVDALRKLRLDSLPRVNVSSLSSLAQIRLPRRAVKLRGPRGPVKMPAALRHAARPPANQPLPEWTYWEIGDWWIGEAVWSVTHGQPIRYGALPERVARVVNLWGPNGRFPNSRFNQNAPSYGGKASTR
jgi:hypothetical protein